MPFFQEPTVIQLAQEHIRQIRELEDSEARRLLGRYAEIRQSLRDRLDTMGEDTFSAQQLRAVIVQVDGAILAMQDGLLGGMKEGAERISLKGIKDIVDEIEDWDEHFTGAAVPISVNSALIASDNNNFLLNRYKPSLEAYSADLRASVAAGLSQAAIEEVTTGEVVRRLSRLFLGEQWKLERIARTEFHHVYNAGKLRTMNRLVERQIPDLKKTLIHPMDFRTADDSKQLAEENPIIPINEPFKFTYTRTLKTGEVKEETRIFMNPPDRPNDRSILVPYRDEWSE